MRRFRSLSILRPRAKADATAPSSPTQKHTKSSKPTMGVSPTSPASAHSKAEICAATIAKRKRAKYAYVRPPPTLAQELAVMQFADGGKLESHIQRVMEEQARLAAGSRPGAQRGVADVYRDDKGGVWWDADEEMEYAHLLGGEPAQDALRGDGGGDVDMAWAWEAFDAEAAEPLAPFLLHGGGGAPRTAPLPAQTTGDDRRSSISSVDSDLDPQYLLPLPENEDPRTAVDDRALASRRIGGAGMSVLSLPARPRRAALHLAKPASFLVGAVFAGGAASPVWSAHEKENALPAQPKPKGTARRRPAPLKLASSAHSGVVVATRRASGRRARQHRAHAALAPTGALPPVPAPAPAPVPEAIIVAVHTAAADVATPRREFIDDSFAPAPLRSAMYESYAYAPPPTPTPSQAPSKMGYRSVKGLFGLGRKLTAVAN
ncbi:hypothetical protein BJ912DRAFT_959783 [Pholiota molesta]|nr:hypothetical protein BJ912DRAFT_959783 [Pholiota molesta]